MRNGKGVPATMFTALIILILFCLARARAAEVTLTWDQNPDTNATYLLYYGPASLTYTNAIECGASLTVTLTGLRTNTPYYFALTARNTNRLESDFSAELAVTLPTLGRSNAPTVQITTFLDTTTNGIAWGTLTQWTVVLAATNPIQYFRPRSSIIQTN